MVQHFDGFDDLVRFVAAQEGHIDIGIQQIARDFDPGNGGHRHPRIFDFALQQQRQFALDFVTDPVGTFEFSGHETGPSTEPGDSSGPEGPLLRRMVMH